MRKLAVVVLLILSLIASVFGLAQAETPAPQAAEDAHTSEEIAGASLEILGEATSNSGAVGMTLYRITLEPGVEIDPHWHGGSVTWVVDSGTLGFTVTSGEVWVRCAECVPDAEPDESGYVLVPTGTEIVLGPGDWIIQHDTTEHAYRNAGDEPVVIDASTTYTLEEEPLAGAGGATPAVVFKKPKPTGCGGGCF